MEINRVHFNFQLSRPDVNFSHKSRRFTRKQKASKYLKPVEPLDVGRVSGKDAVLRDRAYQWVLVNFAKLFIPFSITSGDLKPYEFELLNKLQQTAPEVDPWEIAAKRGFGSNTKTFQNYYDQTLPQKKVKSNLLGKYQYIELLVQVGILGIYLSERAKKEDQISGLCAQGKGKIKVVVEQLVDRYVKAGLMDSKSNVTEVKDNLKKAVELVWHTKIIDLTPQHARETKALAQQLNTWVSELITITPNGLAPTPPGYSVPAIALNEFPAFKGIKFDQAKMHAQKRHWTPGRVGSASASLEEHFSKHHKRLNDVAGFHIKNSADYLAIVLRLCNNPPAGTEMKISEKGDIAYYHPIQCWYARFQHDGIPQSFYCPMGDTLQDRYNIFIGSKHAPEIRYFAENTPFYRLFLPLDDFLVPDTCPTGLEGRDRLMQVIQAPASHKPKL